MILLAVILFAATQVAFIIWLSIVFFDCRLCSFEAVLLFAVEHLVSLITSLVLLGSKMAYSETEQQPFVWDYSIAPLC